MHYVCLSLGHVSLFLTSVKSNDITNNFVNSILFSTEIVFTCIYGIIMSPEHFEIKNKDSHPL